MVPRPISEFRADYPRPDVLIACVKALVELGWDVEVVEPDHVVSNAGRYDRQVKILLVLTPLGDGTKVTAATDHVNASTERDIGLHLRGLRGAVQTYLEARQKDPDLVFNAKTAVLGVMAGLVFALAWLEFVFESSQSGYLVATGICMVSAGCLAAARARLLVVLLLAQIGLLGTEASGELASGHAPLAGLRITDLSVAAALFGYFVWWVIASQRAGLGRTWVLERAAWAIQDVLESRLAKLAALLIAWASVLWLINGASLGVATRGDVRVILLVGAMGVLTMVCDRGVPRNLPVAFAMLGLPIAAKAIAIALSGLWVIGDNDRLQAVLTGTADHTRVILNGGDTILVLIPAVALLAVHTIHDWRLRAVTMISLGASIVALLLSGTRTDLIVAVALVAAYVIARVASAPPRLSLAALALAVFGLLVVGGIGTAMGLTQRFTTDDAPHAGLNFRQDELRSFFHRPAHDILFGDGIGGEFLTTNAQGVSEASGWAHALPLWVMLKIGGAGLLVGLAGVVFLILDGMRYRAQPWGVSLIGDPLLGILVVGGVLALSLTLNRAALPEGASLLGFGLGLFGKHVDLS